MSSSTGLRRSARLAAKYSTTPLSDAPAIQPAIPEHIPPATAPLTQENTADYNRQVAIAKEYMDMYSEDTSNTTRVYIMATILNKLANDCRTLLERNPKFRAVVAERMDYFVNANKQHNFYTSCPQEWTHLCLAMCNMRRILNRISVQHAMCT